jgi:hypothetical protein
VSVVTWLAAVVPAGPSMGEFKVGVGGSSTWMTNTPAVNGQSSAVAG